MTYVNLDDDRLAKLTLDDYSFRAELYRRQLEDDDFGLEIRTKEITNKALARLVLDGGNTDEDHRNEWHIVDTQNRVVCDLDRDCHLLPMSSKGIY